MTTAMQGKLTGKNLSAKVQWKTITLGGNQPSVQASCYTFAVSLVGIQRFLFLWNS